MQISTLNRERSELVSATASRALMLERYERSTELFANMIRMRRDLRALIDGRTTPPVMDETYKSEVKTCICTWYVNMHMYVVCKFSNELTLLYITVINPPFLSFVRQST